MKTLFVVISLIFVALFTSCKKEQTIQNRFVTFGDYTFEVLSGPDEYDNIEMQIRNTKSIGFDCKYFRNGCTTGTLAYRGFDAIALRVVIYPSSRIIKIHKASGLTILEAPFTSCPKPIKIFESAENFFNQTKYVEMPISKEASHNLSWPSAYDFMVSKAYFAALQSEFDSKNIQRHNNLGY